MGFLNSMRSGLTSAAVLMITLLIYAVVTGCSTVVGNGFAGSEMRDSSVQEDAATMTLDDLPHFDKAAFVLASAGELRQIDGAQVIHWDAEDPEAERGHLLELCTGGKRLVVDRTNGEKLIFVDNREMYFETIALKRILDSGCWQGRSSYDLLDYTEIDGIDLEGLEFADKKKALLKKGIRYRAFYTYDHGTASRSTYMLTTNMPISMHAGKYEGTRWVEETISLETPFFVAEQAVNGKYSEAPIIKTKDGYFEVDLEDVEPGAYAFGFNAKTLLPFEVI